MLTHVREGQSNRDWTQEYCASVGRTAFDHPAWLSISGAPLGIPVRVRDGGYAPLIATRVMRDDGGQYWIFDADVSFLPTHWQHI